MEAKLDQWKAIAAIIHEALPEIDSALSQANTPIADRKLKAWDIIRDTMLEVSDTEAFLVSEAHGKFLLIIGEWYRDRYGKAVEADDGKCLTTLAIIHHTPFLVRAPKNFSTPPDKEGLIWIGFPASVQAEENPLDWIENKSVVSSLSDGEKSNVLVRVKSVCDQVRSIGYDLRALEYEQSSDVVDLAGAIGSDFQASARHLCEGSQAGLRASGWDMSQAVEKSLKLFMHRNGATPPHTHDLTKLADKVETVGATALDRSKLALVPSKSNATNLRYGGQINLADAIETYHAGIEIVCDLLAQATPKGKFNAREARFQIKRPPWFEFDGDAFLEELRAIETNADNGEM